MLFRGITPPMCSWEDFFDDYACKEVWLVIYVMENNTIITYVMDWCMAATCAAFVEN